jgi:hypothetical protein
MHIIRDKKSRKIVFIDYTPSDSPKPGKAVFEGFNERTMEIGWTKEKFVSAYFNVDKNGKIVELDREQAVKAGQLRLAPDQKLVDGNIVSKTNSELVSEGIIKLSDFKKAAIENYSSMAFARRSELIPDYKLGNALLGIYATNLVEDYKATVKAFRDEFHRIEALIVKAKKVEDIEAIKENFPTSIVSAARAPAIQVVEKRKAARKKSTAVNTSKKTR